MKFKIIKFYATALLCGLFLLVNVGSAAASKQEQKTTQGGSAGTSAQAKLETVFTFPNSFKLIGIGVSKTGRIFASAPGCGAQSDCLVEVDPKTGQMTPYPNAAWNRRKPNMSGKHIWIEPQAMWVDRGNHLWVLDRSNPKLDEDRLPPKLVEFDLTTNKMMHEYTFQDSITPKDRLNDVRIDLEHRYAYLTNPANKSGLVVLNLDTGQSRLVLAGDPSVVADPKQHLMFGSRIAKVNGKTWVVHSDGIALSPDNKWLYYRPLTDHSYWRIPTAALIDKHLSAKKLANAKEYLGRSVMSGGMIMSNDGVLYVGDLEHHSVVGLKPVMKNGVHRLEASILIKSDKLAWADGFAIYNNYLYIADSHLNETIFSNGYPRKGHFTIFRVKLPREPSNY